MRRTHTLWIPDGTNMVPDWRSEEDRILGAWYYQTRATSILAESQRSPRDSKEDNSKVVLESWCYTRKGVQWYSRRIAAQFQGIPSGVALGTNSPEGGRGSPWGLELHQARWNSGGPWGQEDWDRSGPRGGDWIPGNSRRCSARYKFPRWWRRLDLYQ